MLFPFGSLPDGPLLETKKALLLLDFQNDFVRPDGKLHADNIATFLPKLPDLVARFRENGEVVWVHTEFGQPCQVWSPETGGFSILLKQFVKTLPGQGDGVSSEQHQHHVEDGDGQDFANPFVEPDAEAFLGEDLPTGCQRCCVSGSDGAKYADVLASSINRQKDLVVGKSQYSALADYSLLMQLRVRKVTDLYICGSLSNISVYATVLDAVRHGFSVTIIEDCLGYRDELCHLHAMRQMADNMCAEGIDYQELMDDLAGLLGDVVKEEDYATRYQVDLSRPSIADKRTTSTQSVSEWLSRVQNSTETADSRTNRESMEASVRPDSSGSQQTADSFGKNSSRQQSSTNESSPPRKRSTNDIDGELEVSPSVRLSHAASTRRSSYELYSRPDSKVKKTKIRVRRAGKDPCESPKRDRPPAPVSQSTGDLPGRSPVMTNKSLLPDLVEQPPPEARRSQKSMKKASQPLLGPNDAIGDGTSKVIYDIFPHSISDSAFNTLKSTVAWQKMYHRTGAVPRLVSVQGDLLVSSMDGSTTYPIYRHPADESPELQPFDHTVDMLRKECERQVGHTLNHVLIQHYRNGEDNISEHSDKTLDIVRGSNIVNLSLGAMRTMTLRSKRIPTDPPADAPSDRCPHSPPNRTTQRVPLPHASLFILSSSTNAKFLHSIRADKRPLIEKSEDERAFNGERISLTFRHVGTYITEIPLVNVDSDNDQNKTPHQRRLLIWGQGATAKDRAGAKQVLSPSSSSFPSHTTPSSLEPFNEERSPIQSEDTRVNTQQEQLIIAFGKENHEGGDFDWAAAYGAGFDVVNFTIKTKRD